jgi:hypothetical protein
MLGNRRGGRLEDEDGRIAYVTGDADPGLVVCEVRDRNGFKRDL